MWMQYSSEFLALALVHFLAVLLPGPTSQLQLEIVCAMAMQLGASRLLALV
jgi:hypothetical protein